MGKFGGAVRRDRAMNLRGGHYGVRPSLRDAEQLAELARAAIEKGHPITRVRPQRPPSGTEPPPPRKKPRRQTWERE
jgi:hypothetical protein